MIHTFTALGQYLVADVNSGAVHVLDRMSYDLLSEVASEEKLEEVRARAREAYRALGCTGLARCDFFVERGTGRVLCNELNTMPGFTAISMYPQLMVHAGTPLPQLLDRLVDLALERAEQHG